MTDHDHHSALRPLLGNWLWERGRIGLRWLRCADGAIGFDEGRKSQFADEPLIRVPLTVEGPAGARPAGVGPAGAAAAPWPAVHEPGIVRFLRAAQLGRAEDAGAPAEVARAVHDCVDLGLWAAYQAEALRSQARWALEPMFDDEIAAAVAEDVRRIYVPMRAQLAMYDWAVVHGLPGPLLTSDAPFVDWRVRGRPPMPFVSLPLGPYCLLVGSPSKRTSRAAPVVWQPASAMGPFKDHNLHIVEGARRWIVGTTDEQLLGVQPRFAPPAPPAPPGEANAGPG
jgi:hypothetical protein